MATCVSGNRPSASSERTCADVNPLSNGLRGTPLVLVQRASSVSEADRLHTNSKHARLTLAPSTEHTCTHTHAHAHTRAHTHTHTHTRTHTHTQTRVRSLTRHLNRGRQRRPGARTRQRAPSPSPRLSPSPTPTPSPAPSPSRCVATTVLMGAGDGVSCNGEGIDCVRGDGASALLTVGLDPPQPRARRPHRASLTCQAAEMTARAELDCTRHSPSSCRRNTRLRQYVTTPARVPLRTLRCSQLHVARAHLLPVTESEECFPPRNQGMLSAQPFPSGLDFLTRCALGREQE